MLTKDQRYLQYYYIFGFLPVGHNFGDKTFFGVNKDDHYIP